MRGVKKYISENFFQGKTLLEVGCGYGDVGALFSQLGSRVTSSDVRVEHIAIAGGRHPELTCKIVDSDKEKINQKFDIIVHWGLLYHLTNIESHLADVTANCDYLLLETEVADSSDVDYCVKHAERGCDQAFSNVGSVFSWAMIENLLKKNGLEFLKVTDSVLNAEFHHYDWPVKDDKRHVMGQRCFWICWKTGVFSPLKTERQ